MGFATERTFLDSDYGYVRAMPHAVVPAKLAIVSTYIPRRCGLATYTADLRNALSVATDDVAPVVVAIDRDGHEYGQEVITTIRQDVIDDYQAAVDVLAGAGVGAVLIQHEYGIFGGPDGSHVLTLARTLAKRGIPYLVTLHTVLSRPSPSQLRTLRTLCSRAARVTVFTETARRMVIRSGVAAGHQIAIMPHGAPVVMQSPPHRSSLREELAELLAHLDGKPVLTTFGLLSPGKGIDIAITAMAEVVKRHPQVQYVVAGATHPEILRKDGESYRESLIEQVHRLGLTGQVHFIDDFLSEEELAALLHHTSLFVTPYRSPEQICSGALTFALAAGRPAVSSAYRYAQDMLRYGAGRLVPCGDAQAFAHGILGLLNVPEAMAEARRAAETLGRRITWPAVAVRKSALLREVIAEAKAAAAHAGIGPAQPMGVTPALRLDHLDRLTDEIGIVQFAVGESPELESGYCVDDVARLAIVAADLLGTGHGGALAERWVRQSVRFLIAAFEPAAGMRNMLSYGGAWLDDPHLGDHVGRAMWALGVVVATPACPAETRRAAGALLDELAPLAGSLIDTGLRAGAYALLGLARAERPAQEIRPLVDRLHAALADTSAADPEWRWFEPELTYDNARLAQAMLAGAALLGDDELATYAIDALDWYVRHVGLAAGTLRVVGNHWHHRGEDPARWQHDGDEQPIDAGSCVEALVEVWRYSRDLRYARLAGWAYAWFVGRNRIGARMYVEQTGGCQDGLSPTGPNPNQGAESTLAYYQALLSLVGAGLAVLPDRGAQEGAPERGRPVNRSQSAGAERAGVGSAVAAGDSTLTSSRLRPSAGTGTSVRPGARSRTPEGPL